MSRRAMRLLMPRRRNTRWSRESDGPCPRAASWAVSAVGHLQPDSGVASINCFKSVVSLTLAAVVSCASGMPWQSVTRCRFVPGSAPVPGVRACLGTPAFCGHRGGAYARSRPVDLIGIAQAVEQLVLDLWPSRSPSPAAASPRRCRYSGRRNAVRFTSIATDRTSRA